MTFDEQRERTNVAKGYTYSAKAKHRGSQPSGAPPWVLVHTDSKDFSDNVGFCYGFHSIVVTVMFCQNPLD